MAETQRVKEEVGKAAGGGYVCCKQCSHFGQTDWDNTAYCPAEIFCHKYGEDILVTLVKYCEHFRREEAV